MREYEEEMDEIDERLIEDVDEIIYEDEPEAELIEELADMSNVRAAMLKSANRFKQFDDDQPDGMDYHLSRFVSCVA
jgi:methionine synthase I (cobalamin-dependent)